MRGTLSTKVPGDGSLRGLFLLFRYAYTPYTMTDTALASVDVLSGQSRLSRECAHLLKPRPMGAVITVKLVKVAQEL